MISFYELVQVYEHRRKYAKQECRVLATKLLLERSQGLKEAYKRAKQNLERCETLINRTHDRLQKSIEEMKSLFTIVAEQAKGYTLLKLNLLIYQINRAKYKDAAFTLKHFKEEDITDKLEETSIFLYETNWYQTKQYFYNILSKI